MANRPDTLDIISSVYWVSEAQGRLACAGNIDGYLATVGGSASDRYDALERLRSDVEGALAGRAEARWIVQAIDERLAEVAASMSGEAHPTGPANAQR
jgi:hypothetical protein